MESFPSALLKNDKSSLLRMESILAGDICEIKSSWFCMRKRVIALYMFPVLIWKPLSLSATFWATVLLPDAAGPSIAITFLKDKVFILPEDNKSAGKFKVSTENWHMAKYFPAGKMRPYGGNSLRPPLAKGKFVFCVTENANYF
jgi:hypothetical protein